MLKLFSNESAELLSAFLCFDASDPYTPQPDRQ